MKMKLTYIAVRTTKPEGMKDLCAKYLGAVADEPRPVGKDGQEADTGLADSTFDGIVYDLSFEDGVRIRLIPEQSVTCDALSSVSFASALMPPVPSFISPVMQARPPYAVYLTFTVSSRKRANELAGQLIMEGYDVIREPGFYGVEYYSSSVFDPEGSIIESVV